MMAVIMMMIDAVVGVIDVMARMIAVMVVHGVGLRHRGHEGEHGGEERRGNQFLQH